MIIRAAHWASQRFRPDEGWLPLLLLAALLLLVSQAVVAVRWTPEIGVVTLAAFLGFLLAFVLSRRPVSWRFAWALIMLYCPVVLALYLGRLWPPWSSAIRQNWSLTADRLGGWLEAVRTGSSTNETIVFTFGLGFLAWILGGWAAWAVYRQRQPLTALSLMGLALAANGYFGGAPLWPTAIFVGLAVLLVSIVHMNDVERAWILRGVDYSLEIRRDLVVYGIGAALALFSASLIAPSINLAAISQAILSRPEVRQIEEVFDTAFAGVRRPPRSVAAMPIPPRAGLPRSFLIGDPPELHETLVMTATVSGRVPPPTHWRGLTYDVYTGAGWLASAERQDVVPAGRPISLPPAAAAETVEQTVHWALSPSPVRFTLGLPLAFDQQVTTFWRGLDDLSQVQGSSAEYQAVSRVSTVTPAELRLARLERVPAAILARYTALPNSVPERVSQLARRIVGGETGRVTPYDQAKALERFLRQYPYSLEVELPPPEADPVDYFLFELQTGYCDYYASAMVVLARTLGLPARLGVGFLARPAGEQGVHSIYQIDAHSWAEVYFDGYGWIEFEPTAAFPAGDSASTAPVPEESPFVLVEGDFALPSTSQRQPAGPSPWWLLALLAPLLAGWRLWRGHRRQVHLGAVAWAYYLLQQRALRLGQSIPPSQTPAEFAAALTARLRILESEPFGRRLGLDELQGDIGAICQMFAERQYGSRRAGGEQARVLWRRLRGRLWLLSWLRRLPTLGPGTN
jgi:transglutaminase-like putative cysteine protease